MRKKDRKDYLFYHSIRKQNKDIFEKNIMTNLERRHQENIAANNVGFKNKQIHITHIKLTRIKTYFVSINARVNVEVISVYKSFIHLNHLLIFSALIL